MLQITPHTRILLSVQAVDFRKGIDGLAAVCRSVLKQDPFTGSMFVFRNKRGTAIKILLYDGQGFWLCMKRLSKGRLTWWPESSNDDGQGIYQLAVYELQLLLWNSDPSAAQRPYLWKPIKN
jgi:transposase